MAKAKAEKLIATLIAQSTDLDRFASQLAPEKLDTGRRAFADAIGSTQKTLAQIEQALSTGSSQGPSTTSQKAPPSSNPQSPGR